MTKKKKKSVKSEKQIRDEIQNLFSSNPAIEKFSKDVTVDEMNADFYVQSSTGSTSVVQIKNWDPTDENQERARELASLYKELSSTDNAYVVIPRLANRDSDPENGVVAPDDLYELPEYLSTKSEGEKQKSKLPQVQKAPQKIIFAAMPFAKGYDDTFEVGIQGACLELGYKAVRVDHQAFVGDIVSEIKTLIKRSVAVIGDLSESRPNVLYEIGFAHASRRKVVQICSTTMDNIPFDVRNNKTIRYEKGQTTRLKSNLTRELRAILPETK
jgi:hypothetical protein